MKRNRKIVILFILLILFALFPAFWGIRIALHTRQVLLYVTEAKAIKAKGLTIDSITQACDLSGKMLVEVNELHNELVPIEPVINRLDWLPGVGPSIHQVTPLLDFSTSVSQAGVELCRAWQDIKKEYKTVSQENYSITQFANQINIHLPDIDRADTSIGNALVAGEKIDSNLIPAKYRTDFEDLYSALPLLQQGILVLDDLPRAMSLVDRIQSLLSQKDANGTLSEDIPAVLALLNESAEVTRLLREHSSPLIPVFSELDPASPAGQYFGQLDPLLVYVDSLANAGATISQVILPGLEETNSDQAPDQKWPRIIIDHQPDFALAQSQIDQAVAARERIDFKLLPSPLQMVVERLDRVREQANHALAFIKVAPRLLGADEIPPYLILVQNRDELRATGGYISAFGLLDLEDGRITSLEIESSDENYVGEAQPAPEPMRYIMQANYLVVRDANWSPDFPTSASQVKEMYQSATGTSTSGVIAFDQGLIVRLLEFFGPLDLPEQGVTVDAKNIEKEMIGFREAAIVAGNAAKRKDFMSSIAPALIDRAKAEHDPKRQIALVRLLLESVREGHLLFYFPDPEVESLLGYYGLDGGVRSEQSDYLMLVDSNVGINKGDQYIKRSLAYTVDLNDPQAPSSTIQMSYQLLRPAGSEACHQGLNPITVSPGGYYKVNCYWNYWRLLLPVGESLTSSQFDPVPADYFDDGVGWKNEVEVAAGENSRQMFSGLVVVPSDQSKTVTLKAKLPENVITKDGNRLIYRLFIQKQAGIESLPVEIQIKVPHGYTLSNPPAAWTYDSYQNLITWHGDIQKSQEFTLEFAAAQN
jgi:hypothetical protein